jgi:hypothetical protein
VKLAGRVEQRGKRLVARRGDVVGAGRPALGRKHHRLDAVVTVDQLDRGVVPDHGRHHFEVEVASERLRLIRVEAVADSEREDRDVRVADAEVAHIRLDLHDVAHELVSRVGVESMVLTQAGRQVETRPVHVT